MLRCGEVWAPRAVTVPRARAPQVLQDGTGGGASAQWDASFDDDEFDTEPLPAQPLGAGGGTASFADFGASAPAAPAADFKII